MRRIFNFSKIAFVAILSSGCASRTVILEDAKPASVIVIPDGDKQLAPFSPWGGEKHRLDVRYAAEFLQRYIAQAGGVELPIVTESAAPKENFIALGATRVAARNNIHTAKLAGEGYLIQSVPGGLVIAGQTDVHGLDRGTLFGVYRFLEEFFGVRWYFPGKLGTVVPRTENVVVRAPVRIAGNPFFPTRFGGVGRAEPDWHPVLRYGITEGMIANHTEESWKRLYAEKHPEYFGVDANGRSSLELARPYICYSQPGVLQQWLENIRNYVETGNWDPWRGCSAQPRGKNIPFGPSDTWSKCACEDCMAATKPERDRAGRMSDYIFSFAAKVAEGMQEIDPDLRLWCLAYQSYLLPPEDKALELPDNLCVTLCLYPPTTARMAQPRVFQQNSDMTQEWHRLLGSDRSRLIIWDYFISPNGYLQTPAEHPHVLANYVRFLKDKSLGMFNNGFPPYEEIPYRQTYYVGLVMHRLLWNPELDVDLLREEFCADLFGPAAAEMLAFFQLLEQAWEETEWKRAGTYVVPTTTVFAQNYTPEVIARMTAYFKAAQEKTSPASIFRERIDWFLDDVYGPFFQRAENYHEWSGKLPETRVAAAKSPADLQELLTETVFADAEAMPMRHWDGADAWVPANIYTAFDQTHLYVRAEFEKPQMDLFNKHFRREREAVESADSFALQLRVQPRSQEYLQLLVYPDGNFNSAHINGSGPWEPQNIAVHTEVVAGKWLTTVAIPWSEIIVSGVIPPRLQAQFRHDLQGSSYYDCWSPTLQFEHYPVGRFGRLLLQE